MPRRSPYQLHGPPINTKIPPGKPIPPAHFDRTGPGRVVKSGQIKYIDPSKTADTDQE